MKYILVLFLLFSMVAVSQTAKAQTPLNVVADCTDPTGEKFVLYFQDEVNKSARYRLDPNGATQVKILCIGDAGGNSGISSSVSIVVSSDMDGCIGNIFRLHVLYVFGSLRSHEKAMELLAAIDRTLSKNRA